MRAFDNGIRYFLDVGTAAALDQLHRDQFASHKLRRSGWPVHI
jgi:hypothetical protein